MTVFQRLEEQGIEGIRCGRKNKINTSFIVYRIGETIIDTAPSNQWQHIRPFFQEKSIGQILLTHHHEDHSGNARKLMDMTGVTPLASEQTCAIMQKGFSIPPMQHYIWGPSPAVDLQTFPEHMTLDNGDAIIPIPSPGHAEDMVCLLVPEQGWLFSADLYIARTLRYLRYDENLQVLINSIKHILTLDFDMMLCPHRGIIPNGRHILTSKLTYLTNLCEQTQSLSQQGMPPKRICRQVLGREDTMSYMSGLHFTKQHLIDQSLKVAL